MDNNDEIETMSLVPKEKEEKIKKNIADLQGMVESMIVNDDESLHVAGELLGKVKVSVNRLEELEGQLIKPFEQPVKDAKNWFKTQKEPYKGMEKAIKDKMGVYMAKVAKEAEEEARKAAEAAAKEAAKAAKKGKPVDVAPPLPVARPTSSVQTSAGKATAKKVWKYEIVDESLLPREYLAADWGKIQTAVREGAREIAGLRIYEDTQVSFRS